MMNSPALIRSALTELNNYARDVQRSSQNTVLNAVRRYVMCLGTEPLAACAHNVLPEVDFDAWYEAALQTTGSMVGSGRLEWPPSIAERVAFQAELLRRLAGGQIDLVDYVYNFHYVENRLSTNTQQFVTQDFEPFHRDFVRLLLNEVERLEVKVISMLTSPEVIAPVTDYIAQGRLTELRALRSGAFDLRKLIQLCEEIDTSFQNQCFLAVAALTRALLDHVPPIFGCKSFNEVANNYTGGGKSFKESMHHLQNSARRIGDAHLHVQIRNSESLPTSTQVNFSNDLDVLLAEVVRILR